MRDADARALAALIRHCRFAAAMRAAMPPLCTRDAIRELRHTLPRVSACAEIFRAMIKIERACRQICCLRASRDECLFILYVRYRCRCAYAHSYRGRLHQTIILYC